MDFDIVYGIQPIINNFSSSSPSYFGIPLLTTSPKLTVSLILQIFMGGTIIARKVLEKLSEDIKKNYKRIMLCHFSFKLHVIIEALQK